MTKEIFSFCIYSILDTIIQISKVQRFLSDSIIKIKRQNSITSEIQKKYFSLRTGCAIIQ